MESAKKTPVRFPLRLPPEIDAEVRRIANGEGERPASGINETIVFLLREALKANQAKKQAAAR